LRQATGGVIDGKFYHFGGFDGSSNVNTIFEYDPATDSITTQAATLPTALGQATGGSI
jgi:N-acetylneuraminic acid mutarotase